MLNGIDSDLVPAACAGFGAGEPLVDFDQMLALVFCLVRQLLNQAAPARIGNVLGQLAVFQHVFDFQGLDHHRLVIVNELSRQVVLEVSTGIRQTLVRLSQFEPCFRTAFAAFLAAGKRFLLAAQVRLRASFKKRGLAVLLPFRVDSEMRQPHIDAQHGVYCLQRRGGFHTVIDQQRGIVFASGGAGQGDAFQRASDLAMDTRFNRRELRYFDPALTRLDAGAVIARLLAVLALEPRVTGW